METEKGDEDWQSLAELCGGFVGICSGELSGPDHGPLSSLASNPLLFQVAMTGHVVVLIRE
jgi:hypothetical protein